MLAAYPRRALANFQITNREFRLLCAIGAMDTDMNGWAKEAIGQVRQILQGRWSWEDVEETFKRLEQLSLVRRHVAKDGAVYWQMRINDPDASGDPPDGEEREAAT